MLSFGGLLSEVVGGGSTNLNTLNPGLVKFLSGAVFPVGLIMYVCPVPVVSSGTKWLSRIVLQGQELLTSNMMVSGLHLL